MDFRVLHSGNENNISNDDLMFMQYSNYFGLNAIGKGIDESNEGITIQGCQLIASYTQADDTITAGITDGYIIIDGKQIKCEATASIQFACTYFMGQRRSAVIYAEVDSRFNVLGNKNYDDGQTKDTWKEDRIKLSYSFSGEPLPGTVLVGTAYVAGTQGGTPSPIVVTQYIPSISQAVIKNTGNGDIVSTHRGGRNDECVSVSNLYEAFENWGIKRLTTTTKTNDDGFIFSLPAGYTDAYLISAKYIDGDYQYGQREASNLVWFINTTLNTLTVNFGVNSATYAECLVAISKV